MAKLNRNTPVLVDTKSLRLRAAWLYYNRRLTQKEIAEQLGVSRSTVIRALEEAQKRGEVQISITQTPDECTDLEMHLEERFGLDEAIVVPGSGTTDETANDVGSALGVFLSDVISDDSVIGVGWGRTLNASLRTFRPTVRQNVQVVSLLGGLLEAKAVNPIEYSWRIASLINAECLLFLAPLVVDSADTKRRLVEKCGLNVVFEAAEKLDIAVISCGDFGAESTSLSRTFLSSEDQQSLIAAGAVCDTLCQFLNSDGKTVFHPIHDRVMSVDLDAVSKASHIILASGGKARAPAIRATISRTRCHTLITDEAAARELLKDS
ncbi:sugar-binding transcriptional regulator [Martelella mediterranea]|uniref:DNA-binding transcriptional regulator LsrR (DeoR family) n=1 Tax=Martelella mediterranea TaxID=293089 RepID=A0A4R3NFW9_9HYPH|nr:sugar-binding transcriptional regulator [Martelella mediterranea]TCT30122.1 DNA-binding transcriptional regulator LsrR (DeoR family) [Martelella mediterranea]